MWSKVHLWLSQEMICSGSIDLALFSLWFILFSFRWMSFFFSLILLCIKFKCSNLSILKINYRWCYAAECISTSIFCLECSKCSIFTKNNYGFQISLTLFCTITFNKKAQNCMIFLTWHHLFLVTVWQWFQDKLLLPPKYCRYCHQTYIGVSPFHQQKLQMTCQYEGTNIDVYDLVFLK